MTNTPRNKKGKDKEITYRPPQIPTGKKGVPEPYKPPPPEPQKKRPKF